MVMKAKTHSEVQIMKYVIPFFARLIGYFAGTYIKIPLPASEIKTIPLTKGVKCQIKMQTMRGKIEQLTETEFKEFRSLKTEEAKLQKAEDILGKTWRILSADLGVKVDADFVNEQL